MKSAIENTPVSHRKGQYFNTKPIGAKPAPRTQRKYDATIRKNKKEHGDILTNWLKTKDTLDQEPEDDIKIVQVHLSASSESTNVALPPSQFETLENPMGVTDSANRCTAVTIEEVDDEDLFITRRTLDPSATHILEEDGLGDIPDEVFCDPGSNDNHNAAFDLEPQSTSTSNDPPSLHTPKVQRTIPTTETIDRCISQIDSGKGPWMSRMLRVWFMDFSESEKNLPTAKYGKSNTSMLEDEDLARELHLHL
ncbi:hypothetical protein K435DRAFT_808219 [Dendrothele bispora CBS 962.96]|uniref:Uncharacterized protein n=1 Tax=Dendrothele bispora (strain CBS 962.96) TaxID=1314807 RepID=A0A4S8L2C4_DENBC|nr:hypothetical protein K435DRAFT_808219 [Dendrothele bispora CBS 962.96]